MKKVKPEDIEKVEDSLQKAVKEILGDDAKVSVLNMDEVESFVSKKQGVINELINLSDDDINEDFITELSTNLVEITDKVVDETQESFTLIDIATSIVVLIRQVADRCDIPPEMLGDIISTLLKRSESVSKMTLEQAKEILEKSDCDCEGCSQLRQHAQAVIDVEEGK